MDDSQRVMGGMPTRAELKTRRARATNAPVAFSINEKTERLEARNIDGALIQEYSPGAVGRILDVGGYELKVSFGRDGHSRLSLLLRPGPAQAKPVQVSVFQRRLILPPETSVSAGAPETISGFSNGRGANPCLLAFARSFLSPSS